MVLKNSLMYLITRRRLWLDVLLVGSLSGCALIHHDSPQWSQISPTQIHLAETIHLAREDWPSAQWWSVYRDPQLDALIGLALKQSPTMAVAGSRVAQARSQVEVVKAGTSLQMALNASVDREHVSASGFLGAYASNAPQIGADGPWYTQGTIGLGGSYQFDLWGKQRDQVAAAIGRENAQLAEAATVELEISSDVAQLYFGIQTASQTANLLQQAVAIDSETVAAHTERAARGLEPDTATQQARAQLLKTQIDLTETQSRIKQLREALRALAGAHADDLPEIALTPLPASNASLPATLSYELLARRPDLQAMRWYVQASLSQIDAAKAAFYPSFDFQVFFGLDALHMADLWRHASQQLNLIPGLYLPIFDGGSLNANLRSARTASNTLIAQYNQAVLDAVRDVAVSGTLLQGLEEEDRLQTEKIHAVVFLQDSAEAHYRQGLISKIAAQEARLPVLGEKTLALQIRGQELSQEIALVKALGGGYRAN